MSVALSRHKPGELASQAIARALTSVAVYPVSPKDAERIGLQWSGEGVLATVLAEVRPPGALRVLASVPDAVLPDGRYPGARKSALHKKHRLPHPYWDPG